MGGNSIPGPIGADTNAPQIPAGTSMRNALHPPGLLGLYPWPDLAGGMCRVPVEPPPPTLHPGSGEALSLEGLWNIAQSKRGFESSPSPFKADRGDELRARPATIAWDAAGHGAKLGDPVETFAVLQVLDKNGRVVAIGADFFDKGPLRATELDPLDKHAEARVLRALRQGIPGEVAGGSLIGVVDQNVCPACRAKLEAFARALKLKLVSVQVPVRAKLSGAGMASPKTTSRTSLQDLRNKAGQRVQPSFRESFRLESHEPLAPMPLPTFRARLRAAGGTIGEALIGLLLEIVAAKILEHIERRTFEERMRELQPQIEQRMLDAYNEALARGELQPQRALYFNIQIRAHALTTIYVAGRGSGMIPGSFRPEVQSVRISDRKLATVEPVQETTRMAGGGHAVMYLEQTQVLTYSQPVPPPDPP